MSTSASQAAESQRTWRVAPSVPIAIGVFIAYVVVFIGLSATSGIAYDQWFASGGNAFRAAVLPLLGGSAVLIAFLLWARWDWVFKDPARLRMYGFLWVPMILFAIGIIVHFTGVNWERVPTDLLLAILAAGVLVGFAEETLFRGIVLRSLRTNGRAEAWVMLISSLWFGFFHLTNIANGSSAATTIVQCVIASASGVVLYLFRRWRGLLVFGMVAHGVWDISSFFPVREGGTANTNLAVQGVIVICAVIAAIIVIVRDRTTVVTETGLQPVGPSGTGGPHPAHAA